MAWRLFISFNISLFILKMIVEVVTKMIFSLFNEDFLHNFITN